MKEMASRRVLLCIDNLETLLRDHPQEFEDFVQALPHEWRVIVTSRVSVNGANVIALGPIRREGAVKLVWAVTICIIYFWGIHRVGDIQDLRFGPNIRECAVLDK